MAQLKNMGDMQSLLGMMPGIDAKALSSAQVDDKLMARQEAIILSMTKAERENPSIINSSRKKRIAAGSGTNVVEVNRLLKQYELMMQLTKQLSKGKMPFGMGKNMGNLGKLGSSMGKMHGFGRKKRLK